jgi:hypothetical protein
VNAMPSGDIDPAWEGETLGLDYPHGFRVRLKWGPSGLLFLGWVGNFCHWATDDVATIRH